MGLYLYLNEESHAATWCEGGEAPLRSASTYRAAERSGIYTPDENLIDDSSHDVSMFGPAISFGENVRNGFIGCIVVNGREIARNVRVERHTEDGLILCLSSELSEGLMHRLNKRCCVQIDNIDALAEHISKQLGVVASAGACEYTTGHRRHHFLKSMEDSWMKEYRLFWPMAEREVWVKIAPGTATRVL